MPVKHKLDGNKIINSTTYVYYVCEQPAKESPHDEKRLWYFSCDFIYMVVKSEIFIKCNAKKFDF